METEGLFEFEIIINNVLVGPFCLKYLCYGCTANINLLIFQSESNVYIRQKPVPPLKGLICLHLMVALNAYLHATTCWTTCRHHPPPLQKQEINRYVCNVGWLELPSDIFTLGTIRPEYSGAVFCWKKPESQDFWACLGVNPLDISRTLYLASEGNTCNNSPSFIALQWHLNDH